MFPIQEHKRLLYATSGLFFPIIAGIGLLMGCKAVSPDSDTGPVLDASRNVASAVYHPASRPDNPFPRQTLVFIRHFYYFTRLTSWTIISSGETNPGSLFEQAGLYLYRDLEDAPPEVLRIVTIPGIQTDGITTPKIHISIAARTAVLEDGQNAVRNVSGDAVVYLEDGPLYGGFSVDIPDTISSAQQAPRLFIDGRVRRAALSSAGDRVVYADIESRVWLLDAATLVSERLVDLRETLGPASVTGLQWVTGSEDSFYIRLEQGTGPEVWVYRLSDRQLSPTTVSPVIIQEPGEGQLSQVNDLTGDLLPVDWDVPAPERFTR